MSRLLLFALLCAVAVPSGRAARLRFTVLDADSGQPTAARFQLKVNGVPWSPRPTSRGMVQFVSYHDSKRQLFVANYADGKGEVDIGLPAEAERVELAIAKGFEFIPVRVALRGDELARAHRFTLKRWVNMAAEGWLSADAHLHYDRFSRRADAMWFAMMAGDDLASAHFMYLIGGKVPGEWAVQYGYGKRGEASDGRRLISAGLEYRDTLQGHANLLGMPEIIQPVMAGRGGLPNYPTLDSVLRRTRQAGGLPAVAHGGSLGGRSTVLLDGVLGSPDAMEIGNSHLYSLDNWYRLMNAGFFYPPVAGTDLPNFPERDWWQPFLGGMRMYARVGEKRDWEAWKAAVQAGRVFVTSGPLVRFRVEGREMGDTIHLDEPGTVRVEAAVESILPVQSFELVRNGEVVHAGRGEDPTARLKLKRRSLSLNADLEVRQSCWLAVRARSVPIEALKRAQLPPTPYHCSDAVAHSGVIRVIVGGRPIGSPAARDELVEQLRRQRAFYAERGRYESAGQKAEMLGLFDRALDRLRGR